MNPVFLVWLVHTSRLSTRGSIKGLTLQLVVYCKCTPKKANTCQKRIVT